MSFFANKKKQDFDVFRASNYFKPDVDFNLRKNLCRKHKELFNEASRHIQEGKLPQEISLSFKEAPIWDKIRNIIKQSVDKKEFPEYGNIFVFSNPENGQTLAHLFLENGYQLPPKFGDLWGMITDDGETLLEKAAKNNLLPHNFEWGIEDVRGIPAAFYYAENNFISAHAAERLPDYFWSIHLGDNPYNTVIHRALECNNLSPQALKEINPKHWLTPNRPEDGETVLDVALKKGIITQDEYQEMRNLAERLESLQNFRPQNELRL